MNPNTYWATIQNPGKFEGDPVLCRYLWKKSMDGADAEIYRENESSYQVFFPTEAESIRWGLEPKTHALVLCESEQGFVTMSELTEYEYNRLEEQAEQSETEWI